MPDQELARQIDAALAYQKLFVPALFEQWAARVADAADLAESQCVLDVACGTGVLAHEAAARVGATGKVVGVDPDRGMLAVAHELTPYVEWREGTAEDLPLPDGAFDAVVCQFGLMFFTDREKALREMVRVAVPDGRVAVAVWDTLENAPAYAAEVATLERVAGKRAADALRAPFVLGKTEALARLFENAGVADVAIATQCGSARFPSVRTMVEADLRGWLPVLGVHLPEAQVEAVLNEAETALAPHVTSDGTIEFDLPAHIVIGRASAARRRH